VSKLKKVFANYIDIKAIITSFVDNIVKWIIAGVVVVIGIIALVLKKHLTNDINIPYWLLYLLIIFSLLFIPILRILYLKYYKTQLSPYIHYTRDIFEDVLYEWEYDDKEPTQLMKLCPDDYTQLLVREDILEGVNPHTVREVWYCPNCIKQYDEYLPSTGLTLKTKRIIQRNIVSGEWKNRVKKIETFLKGKNKCKSA